jgi:membrane-associated phospholipid phosphatase
MSDEAGPQPGVIRTVAWSTLAVALVALAAVTAVVLGHPDGTALDTWMGTWALNATVESGALATLARALDILGGTVVEVVLVAVVVVELVIEHRRRLAACLIASGVGGAVLCQLVKAWVDRPRPPSVGIILSESSLSYPSAHATAGITVYVAVGLVVLLVLRPARRWWIATPLLVLGPVIGVSRVFAGVHWATDVLGGWSLGSAWLAGVVLVALAGARAR